MIRLSRRSLFLIVLYGCFGICFALPVCSQGLHQNNPIVEAIDESGKKVLLTQRMSFGLPVNAFTLQAKFNSFDPDVFLLIHNCRYYGTMLNREEDLSFVADGQSVRIGKPFTYQKKGVERRELDTLSYRVPLQTFQQLVHAKNLTGFLKNRSLKFDAQKVDTLRQFSARVLEN